MSLIKFSECSKEMRSHTKMFTNCGVSQIINEKDKVLNEKEN